tara:strand:+ start:3392 stop:5281 length:1890 start_codon:yes stop_codon:yes gene_type:complete
METGAIGNLLKNSMQSLFAGVAGAVVKPSGGLVPAIVPVPIDDVNTQYASDLQTYEPADKKEDKEEEPKKEVKDTIEQVVPRVAQQKNLPYNVEVELAEGAIVRRDTVARVGEAGPEAVIPIDKYKKSVEAIYKEGAALLISSSLGFLKTLPASPAKGGVMSEVNKIASVFGIAETPKPKQVIGLKKKLAWWGGMGAASTATAIITGKGEDSKKGGGGGGNPLSGLVRGFNNLRKMKLGKRLKSLKKFKVGRKIRNIVAGGKKATKGISKVAKSGGKLLKGASKAGKALLKKGAKKVAAKVGGKAIAKVGAKALGKGLLKKIPFVGLGAGLLFAGQRLMAGDMKGALLEAASGIAGTIPGVGTAISVGLDATLAAKDMGVLPGQKEAEQQQEGLQAPDPMKDMYGRPIILNPSTMKAWKKAVNAAAKDGIDLPKSVTSSFRSPEQQQALLDAAAAGDQNVMTPAAVGQSPHGQGWAVDIDYYSKANEWMRNNGSKFGFKWQGEADPVHFDFWNNEPNNKWLQPGNTDWMPNAKDMDPVGKKSSGQTTLPSSTSPSNGGTGSAAASTINNEPVTKGTTDPTTGEPIVIPVTEPRIVYVDRPSSFTGSRARFKNTRKKTIIDPMGKGVLTS